jgi:hypothetical protein
MERGQFAAIVLVVAVAGVIGGALAVCTLGQHAAADGPLKPQPVLREAESELKISQEQLRELVRTPKVDLPDEPIEMVQGTINWITYDTEAGFFGAILARPPKETILVRTADARMQSALETAYLGDDTVAIVAQHVTLPDSLMPIWNALSLHTH